jgi:hypothetical protein
MKTTNSSDGFARRRTNKSGFLPFHRLYLDSSSEDGRLLLSTRQGVYRTEHDIRSWFRLWLDDLASRGSFFDSSQAPRKTGIIPFTREPIVYVGEGPPFGELIHRWSEHE